MGIVIAWGERKIISKNEKSEYETPNYGFIFIKVVKFWDKCLIEGNRPKSHTRMCVFNCPATPWKVGLGSSEAHSAYLPGPAGRQAARELWAICVLNHNTALEDSLKCESFQKTQLKHENIWASVWALMRMGEGERRQAARSRLWPAMARVTAAGGSLLFSLAFASNVSFLFKCIFIKRRKKWKVTAGIQPRSPTAQAAQAVLSARTVPVGDACQERGSPHGRAGGRPPAVPLALERHVPGQLPRRPRPRREVSFSHFFKPLTEPGIGGDDDSVH